MTFILKQPGQKIEEEVKKKEGFSAVVYGPPLVGKTTTLALDPDFQYLLIDFDKNTTTLNESPNVMIATCDTFNDYLDVKESVRRGYFQLGKERIVINVDCVVIDSFTSMEEKIKLHVATEFAPARRREIEKRFGAQSDWGDLQEIEIAEVRDWQAMTKRANNPINVIWIGHDQTITNDMGIAVSTGIALQGKYAAPRIISAVDAAWYMFKAEKNGEVGRFIRTMQSGIYMAETRMPIQRRSEMPNVIKSPKWSEIFKIMGYVK